MFDNNMSLSGVDQNDCNKCVRRRSEQYRESFGQRLKNHFDYDVLDNVP